MPRTHYTFVTFGPHGSTPRSAGRDCIPRGPWPSRSAALAALARWRERVGAVAGSIEAARTCRLYGYSTRAAARAASIADDLGAEGRVE